MVPNKNNPIVYSSPLTFLTLLYFSIFVVSTLLISKQLVIFGLHASLGSFIIPFNFVILDIITEIYGYKVAQKVIWQTLLVQGIFCIASVALIKVPSPATWHHQDAYNYIFSPLLRIYLSGIIAVPVSLLLNAFIISKWKILLRGKYFWLRSIGSSFFGDIVFTAICALVIFSGVLGFKFVLQIMLISLMLKILFLIILAFPANLIVLLLRRYERVDVFDYSENFNPFRS